MIFNVKEQPEHLCNIKVVQKMKYLGIEIDNKRNYFKTQRRKIIELIEKEVKEQGHAIHGNATFPMVLREHLTVIYT